MKSEGESAPHDKLPSYSALPVSQQSPPRSSWGVWAERDPFGCLNLLTPERVRAAATLVRTGKVFSLNWNLELPDPPLFRRRSLRHRVLAEGQWQDDELTSWNTQSSTQWDGFRHVRSEHGYYGGLSNEEHGIHHWARRGIVGRGVLVDLLEYRRSLGNPLSMNDSDSVPASELAEAIARSRVEILPGDILLLHTGWIEWYADAGQEARDALASDLRSPGLAPSEELFELLWDLHLSAIAADNPSVEVWPPRHMAVSSGVAHLSLLPLLGLPLGELFDLSALAADCASDGVHEGLFTSAPLNLVGGVASPPNALFIK